jgi:hypothetical protein
MFVWGDEIFDISMGLPLEELYTYFLPLNISFEEHELGNHYDDFIVPLVIRDMEYSPSEKQKKALADAKKKINTFEDRYADTVYQRKRRGLFEKDAKELLWNSKHYKDRCRVWWDYNENPPRYHKWKWPGSH